VLSGATPVTMSCGPRQCMAPPPYAYAVPLGSDGACRHAERHATNHVCADHTASAGSMH
jgi:hypothetical protein